MKFQVNLEADFYGVDSHCFKLNNYVFEAVEDPDDGYRSCMAEIQMKDNIDNLIFFGTPIGRVRVEECSRETNYADGIRCLDGYKLVDIEDGHVWLRFGTDESESYYPSFFFNYQTKNEKMISILEQ
jgi:hypothetical protein